MRFIGEENQVLYSLLHWNFDCFKLEPYWLLQDLCY